MDPGNASYNVAVRWRLEGRVSTDLLERAWLAIIERHEILRSVFLEVDGAPIQRIMPTAPFRMAEIDLSTLAPDQQQLEGDRIGVIEARAPFDVGTGPLIRATLLRFSSVVSIILVTTHQIVSDGWSIGVMAREMGVIYDALRHDKPAPLEPLSIQYADYTLWQLEWLRVRGTAAETEYWTKQLAGVKPFRVIADRPRPAMPTTNGVIVSARVAAGSDEPRAGPVRGARRHVVRRCLGRTLRHAGTLHPRRRGHSRNAGLRSQSDRTGNDDRPVRQFFASFAMICVATLASRK